MISFKRLVFVFFIIVFINNSIAFAEFDFTFFRLAYEPTVRIGLATNARSVSISTTDSSLVAVSPDEPSKFLNASNITVTARAYRPPEIEIYNFDIPNIASK
jgi:hypothetical protein